MSSYPAWWQYTVSMFTPTVDSSTGATTWTKTVHSNCFWKLTTQREFSDGAFTDVTKTIVRIPGNVNVKDGCILLQGTTNAAINEYASGQRSTDFIKANRDICTVVKVVRNNNLNGFTGMGHMYIEGDK